MEQSKKSLQFNQWTKAEAEEKAVIARAFLRQEYKTLAGYVVFLGLMIAFLVIICANQVNWAYIGVFGIISLGAAGGIVNQVKEISKIRNSEFEKRDAFIRKLQYTGKVNRQVSIYEAEILEQNQYKMVCFAKNYSKRKVRPNDKVVLVRVQKGQDICIYRVL